MSTQKYFDITGNQFIPAASLVDASGNGLSATTGASSNVAASSTDVLLLAANTLRKGAILYNDSSAVLYVLFGITTSTVSNYTQQVAPGGSLSLSQWEYSGMLRGLWASTGGFARVTELT